MCTDARRKEAPASVASKSQTANANITLRRVVSFLEGGQIKDKDRFKVGDWPFSKNSETAKSYVTKRRIGVRELRRSWIARTGGPFYETEASVKKSCCAEI